MRQSIKIALLTTLLLSGLGITAQAQGPGVFARLGFGARGMAMGNALAADASGFASPYYNPALSPFTAEQHLSATVALLTLDRALQFLQVAVPLEPNAGLSVGLIHGGVSGIDGRDNSGFHTGNLSTDEYALFITFGTKFGDRVAAGLGLRLYRTDLLDSRDPENTIALNLGVHVKVRENLHVGLALDDLLAQYTWDSAGNTAEQFPFRLRLGATYQLLEGQALIAAEYESRVAFVNVVQQDVTIVEGTPVPTFDRRELRLHNNRFRIGGEWWLSEPFAVRAGIDRIGEDGLKAITPTFGFAFKYDVGQLKTRFHYAFVLEPYAVGTMHLLTLYLNL